MVAAERQVSRYPGVVSWTGLLLGILCFLLWQNSTGFVAWLFANRFIVESGVFTASEALKVLLPAGCAVGAVVAWRAILLGVRLSVLAVWKVLTWCLGGVGAAVRLAVWLMNKWGPTRALLIQIDRVATPLVRPVWEYLSTSSIALATVASRWLQAVSAQAIRISLTVRQHAIALAISLGAALLWVLHILSLAGRGAGRGIRLVIAGVSLVVATVVFSPLIFVGVALATVVPKLCSVFAKGVLSLGEILAVPIRPLWWGVSAAFRGLWWAVCLVLFCLWWVIRHAGKAASFTVALFVLITWEYEQLVVEPGLIPAFIGRGLRAGGSAALLGLRHALSPPLQFLQSLVVSLLLAIFGLLGLGFRSLGRGLYVVFATMWRGIAFVLVSIWRGVVFLMTAFWRGIALAMGFVGRCVLAVLVPMWRAIVFVFASIGRGLLIAAKGVVAVLLFLLYPFRLLWSGIVVAARALGQLILFPVRLLWAGVCLAARYVWRGIASTMDALWAFVVMIARLLGPVLQVSWSGVTVIVVALARLLLVPLYYAWLGLSTLAKLLAWAGVIAFGWLSVVGRRVAAVLSRTSRQIESATGLSRSQVTSGVSMAGLAALGIVIFVLWPRGPEPVIVTHWGSGHVSRPALLPEMAAQFNKAGYKTASGRPIKVQFQAYGSTEQTDDLISRITRGTKISTNIADPVLVTPSSSHWLVSLNHAVGRDVVDLHNTKSIAVTWIGIATYRDMAECLGWPNKEIGFADIVALSADPRGWGAYPCAKAEWGEQPLVAFTDPITSTTGRSVLLSLYSIAAGKSGEQLTVADVSNPAVSGYVKQFQQSVDHYMVSTLLLNTKIFLGPRYGHFFFLPEDNMVSLYEGKESVIIGTESKRQPITRPMVMIYPKEGSPQNHNPAGVIRAPWVTPEQVEGAGVWTEFLLQDAQQRRFMSEGFRPATQVPVSAPISARYGLDPAKPTVKIDPDQVDPKVISTIVQSWEDVKKPGVVTFVVDGSGSMFGAKLAEAKRGLTRALDGTAKNNRVGFVTFSDTVKTRVAVAPLAQNRGAIIEAIEKMQANGETALYEAIEAGIKMTDEAPGDGNEIRGVVVLTDGRANRGSTRLSNLVEMHSTTERKITQCTGFEHESECLDFQGKKVAKKDIVGSGLALNTRNRILIFFIGIGSADLEVGRILAGATGAAFQGTTEQDLGNVLEEFGKYF